MMKNVLFVFIAVLSIFSCDSSGGSEEEPFSPTYVELDIPEVFKDRVLPPVLPSTNPLTEEGIYLGKKIFYDPILSRDNTISCSTCHIQERAFTNHLPKAIGIDGQRLSRNTISLTNLAWNYNEVFTWDGHTNGIEKEVEKTIENPLEMDNSWDDAVNNLQNSREYPALFKKAFGKEKITKEFVIKAIAQFLRTIVSANSKFDKYLRRELDLTYDERVGYSIFEREEKGDCFHCHGGIHNPLWTDNSFHNNGMDSIYADIGLENVTGKNSDRGKFKTPSLRNLKYTAPYMHDGRFATLDEVIEQYSEHVIYNKYTDPLMEHAAKGGVHLTDTEKKQLKAFLLTLTDESFINSEKYKKEE